MNVQLDDLKGSITPRYSIYKEGNSSFYPAVKDLCDRLGLTPYPWQEEVLKAIYAITVSKDSDGVQHWDWANRIVCISTGRQPGKGRIAEIVELADIHLFGASTVLHTAQGQTNARVAFKKLKVLVDAFNKVAGEDQVKIGLDSTPGKEVFRFPVRMSHKKLPKDADPALKRQFASEAQEIKYIVRTSDKMLGNSVDTLVIDEAQLLKKRDWSEVLPTLAARPNSHSLLIGNPPQPGSTPEQFHHYRELALKAIAADDTSSVAWFEWSAETEDDPADPMTWAKAHPGLGYSITPAMFQEQYDSAVSLADFQLSFLGMWDAGSAGDLVIPMDVWRRQIDTSTPFADTGICVGIDIDYLGKHGTISIAGQLTNGNYRVSVYRSGEGTDWIVSTVEELVEQTKVTSVVADMKSRVADMKQEFENANIRLTLTDYSQLIAACDVFEAGILGGWLHHGDDLPLTLGMQGATWKTNPEGGQRRWDRKKSSSPIHSLMASTLAAWGGRMEETAPREVLPAKPKVNRRSAERRKRILIAR